MSVRLIVDERANAGSDRVAMYDSVSGWAFGPVMDGEETADAFLAFCNQRHGDPRSLTDVELGGAWSDFNRERGDQ